MSSVSASGRLPDRMLANAQSEKIAMPKYVVHIGPPKTGSKYIQSQLYHSRSTLIKYGILYPDIWWTRPDQVLHDVLAERLQRDTPELRHDFDRLNAAGHRIVVLSCEGFDDLSHEKIALLRDLIGDNPVEIIYYVRRWTERIPSDWRQRSMMGQFRTFPEYYVFYLNDFEGTGEINYSIVWKKYADTFGRDSIKLISHSNLRDRHVDIFDHFCRVILQIPEPPVVAPGFIQNNISPDLYESELLRALNFIHYLRTNEISKFIRVKLLALRTELDLGFLGDIMANDLTQLEIRDDAQPLHSSWNRMNAYRDCLISKEYGEDLFERRHVEVPYIGSNYLIRPGALEALQNLYTILLETPVEHPELG
jgi:hypothetical protein